MIFPWWWPEGKHFSDQNFNSRGSATKPPSHQATLNVPTGIIWFEVIYPTYIYIIIYTVYIILFNGPASGGPPSTPGDGDGPFFCICKLYMFIYTLWLFNIAMGFIDGLPI